MLTSTVVAEAWMFSREFGYRCLNVYNWLDVNAEGEKIITMSQSSLSLLLQATQH